eukprot:TRINITY_DN95900_c0_g1_i1.p1 TRINITY_DN95900_c0_g1~~TRINITY_DN95900_c0_g1_i1.p1  ORF type:complete len:286 (+),score=38.01 TRINITY_DN95900_c0_g1_i1:78-935(+)
MTATPMCNGHTKQPGETHRAVTNGVPKHKDEAEELDSYEPDVQEHLADIGCGSLVSAGTYGACRLFFSKEQTEDMVDMVHSAASSCVAVHGFMSMTPHPLHVRALPPKLASASGPVVRMFKYSLGYFAADLLLIIYDICILRKFPKLWIGRLFHHFIQFAANAPCIFGKGCSPQQNLAVRSTLCMAYMAELSSVFLRASNLARGGPLRTRQLVNWTLVASFFYARIWNFPRATLMYLKAKPLISQRIFRLQLSIQAAGCALSAGWFTKILQIALKTKQQIPSIEC